MSLSKNIADKRRERKLSQEYVAERLGVSRQAVSKWETGQTEPTAKNLVELAKLFDVTVSELVEPDNVSRTGQKRDNRILRRNLEVIAVGAFSGFAILSTVMTDDPGFYIYVSILVFLTACVMAYNISRLPAEIRLKMALKELAYCAVVWCLVTFLPERIGNVFTSVLVMILCVVYAVWIRFPDHKKEDTQP